ncbi:hypothetical protein GCM10025762_18120 [Haloechinothrix salitolerans]
MRWLPNPFHDPNFRDLSGLDTPVQRFLLAHQETERWLAAAIELLRSSLRATQPDTSPVRVAVGCNGGHDRSVGIVEILARRLRSLDVWVLHQDLHHRAGGRSEPFTWRRITAEHEGR